MGRGLYIHRVSCGDDRYKQALRLRDEVLGKPFGLEFDHRFTGEDGDAILHGCVAWQDEVVSTATLVRIDAETVKMRQVATAPDMQGLGLGSRLMAYLEGFAAAKGYRRIQVSARCSARGFYEKTGYTASSEETFLDVGLPHLRMSKEL